MNLETKVTRKRSLPNFLKNEHFLPLIPTRIRGSDTHTYQGVKNLHFSKNLLFSLLTYVLRFAFLPYYRRLNIRQLGYFCFILLNFWICLCVFFLSTFSFTDTDDSQDIRRIKWNIRLPLFHFHPLTNTETFIYFIFFLISAHVPTSLLLDEIYAPLEISIWLNLNFSLLIYFISAVINSLLSNVRFELPSTTTLNCYTCNA